MTETWRDVVDEAKDTLRSDFLDFDPDGDISSEFESSIDNIVDSQLGGGVWPVFEWVYKANLAHVEPDNTPDEPTPYNICRAVLEEDLRNTLEAYARDLENYTPVCAGGHYVDDENETTRACHICGADYCGDQDHGFDCAICGEETCHNCLAIRRGPNNSMICDECADELDTADEAEEK